jgi:DnaJ-class molecular chaperone
MERFKNYYRILNIDSAADDAAIKAAFRRLARRYHPDAKNARAARRFPEIREAYEVLCDPEKRRHYDQVYRAQTAVRPLADGHTSPKLGARARSGSVGLGISLDVLGLRVGLALDAEARRSAAGNLPRRSQRKKR